MLSLVQLADDIYYISFRHLHANVIGLSCSVYKMTNLLSDGKSDRSARAESFLLSGWVILSMRSTHISIILPKSWSAWKAEITMINNLIHIIIIYNLVVHR